MHLGVRVHIGEDGHAILDLLGDRTLAKNETSGGDLSVVKESTSVYVKNAVQLLESDVDLDALVVCEGLSVLAFLDQNLHFFEELVPVHDARWGVLVEQLLRHVKRHVLDLNHFLKLEQPVNKLFLLHELLGPLLGVLNLLFSEDRLGGRCRLLEGFELLSVIQIHASHPLHKLLVVELLLHGNLEIHEALLCGFYTQFCVVDFVEEVVLLPLKLLL